MTDYATELSFALEAAHAGGKIAMGHFRKGPSVKKKDDGTFVTEADWAAESQIRLRIARMFPDHNILGEEDGLTGSGGGEPKDGAPTWVVDPIDGTNNYIHGIPIWGTLVALQVDGRSVLGVAHAPALGETYDAIVGAGARMNGNPIAVNETTGLSEAMIISCGMNRLVEAGLTSFYVELTKRSYRSRGFGDFWGHLLVARGASHVMIEPSLWVWDYAALEPIITEAGGRATRLDGGPLRHGSSIVTTNGKLHDEVLGLVRSHAPDWTEPAP